MVEMGSQNQDQLPLSWVTQGDLEKRFGNQARLMNSCSWPTAARPM
jgi:hypothetical protein